jgi:peptidoglycan hydrolase-like protein with peptidoglycan-binding domain
MKSTMRWLSAALWLAVLCASASAAQHAPKSGSQSHKSTAPHPNAHPSHPMRNSSRKHHSMTATNATFLPVRYAQPQQNGSATPKNTSASSGSNSHSSSASSKKKKSGKKSKYSRREPLQKAPTPERISEIQSSLARNGYYQGDPNGKWDANTVAAVQKFQSANGLDASGKLDATTLQKLGLGSGIAGVSAPRPPCCSSTPHDGSSCCSATPAGNSPAPSTPAAPAKPAAAAPVPANSTSTSSSSAPAANASTASNASSDADAKTSQR